MVEEQREFDHHTSSKAAPLAGVEYSEWRFPVDNSGSGSLLDERPLSIDLSGKVVTQIIAHLEWGVLNDVGPSYLELVFTWPTGYETVVALPLTKAGDALFQNPLAGSPLERYPRFWSEAHVSITGPTRVKYRLYGVRIRCSLRIGLSTSSGA